MSTHKYIDRVCCIIMIFTLIVTLVYCNGEALGINVVSRVMGYEDKLFDTSYVHTLDIVMDDWDEFIDGCEDEEYVACSVVIDNDAYKNVGIRAKGNTSLSSVKNYGNDRYSFKIEFDKYDSGKTYYGLDKLSLNNIIQDNTYMKDYLAYQMMGYFGVDAPLCSYVYITVNGEDWGLYLAVEGVEESFLQRNYGSDYGELYKPDSMSMGGGRGNGGAFDMDEFREDFDEEDAAASDGDAVESMTPPVDSDSLEAPDFTTGGNGPGAGQFGGMELPDGAEAPDMGEIPDGAEAPDAGELPDGMEAPAMGELPDGAESPAMGEMPDGTEMPDMGEIPDGAEAPAMGELPDGAESPAAGELPDGAEAPDMGELPDGAGQPGAGGMQAGQMTPGAENAGMGSDDVSLIYSDDDYDSYSNIFDNAKTDISDTDKDRLIAALKKLNACEDIESVVDVDEVIRYFVVHNFVCNFDSYTGSMIHNYYLYEEDGQLSMIPWDYNLAFGGFSMGAGDSATEMVNYPVDTPVSGGTIDSRPMLAWIFEDEAYTELYHAYFAEFIEGYFDSGYFEELIDSTESMIAPYVEKDPTKFCTYEEFETGVETLREFCLLRAESISGQLDGTIPSTSDAQKADSSNLIDASDITISDMGTMGNMDGGMEKEGRR